MAKVKRSEFTEAVLRVTEEVAQAKDKSNEADPVPLMTDRMSMSEGRKEFEKMSEFQRQMFLDSNGQQKLLDMVRGGSEFDASI
jgi:hypothetical protein